MAVNTTIQVVMPQMGDSVTEGTILEWHKQEGDTVEVDETIVEISTDKVDAEVPATAAGTIVKIHGEEGDTVAVGAVLAEISTNGAPAASGDGEDELATGVGDSASEGDPAPGTEAHEEAADTEEGAAEEAPPADGHTPGGSANGGDGAAGATGGKIVDIVAPSAGESVAEATILEWSKAVGDAVEEDETIVEVSTDKVDMELPAPVTGTLTEILAEEGATIHPGDILGRIAAGAGAEPKAAPAADSSGDGDGEPAEADAELPDGTKVSPVARRVASVEGVDLGSVQGSGPGGRVTKSDVLAAADGGNGASATKKPAAGAKPAGATLLKGGAAMLARYMDESRSIPTATSFRTMTVTVMDARRKELKAAGKKVSFTHLIAYAIAKAATDEMPVMAHHFEEIDGKPHRIDDGAVNLGIAVDVEKKDGSRTLMVPVIRDAGRLSFTDFLDAFNQLIDKARTNSLTADDLTGANVSLTNPGGIGTIASVPRLMTGQGTIVATGSIAYPVGLGSIGDMIGAEKVMSMTSTYDHRIIQGAESGRFLKEIEELLQGEQLYKDVFDALGVSLGPAPSEPAPAAAAAAARDAAPPAPDPRARRCSRPSRPRRRS